MLGTKFGTIGKFSEITMALPVIRVACTFSLFRMIRSW